MKRPKTTLATLVAEEAAAAHAGAPRLEGSSSKWRLVTRRRLVRERRGDVLDANAERRRRRGRVAGRRRARPPAARRASGRARSRLALEATASLAAARARRAARGCSPDGLRDRRAARAGRGRSARTSRRGQTSPPMSPRRCLKSGNAVVLRTGGAALAHRDCARRLGASACARGGGHPAGGGRSRPDARSVQAPRRSSRCPDLIPLVILRGSGPSTAALARRAAEHGVRTLAHAEGGGVLYVHGSAADPREGRGARAGEPRPARRLQPAQPRARRLARTAAAALLPVVPRARARGARRPSAPPGSTAWRRSTSGSATSGRATRRASAP